MQPETQARAGSGAAIGVRGLKVAYGGTRVLHGIAPTPAAMRATLTDAVAAASGKPPADLKDAKRRGMAEHGRRGQACPVCGMPPS